VDTKQFTNCSFTKFSKKSLRGKALQFYSHEKTKQTPWPESTKELYRPSDRRLTAKLVPTFAGREVLRSQRNRSPRKYSWFSRPEPLIFISSSSSIVLMRLIGPRSSPLFHRKCSIAGNRTRAFRSVTRNSYH
jgi:hypothetical protein